MGLKDLQTPSERREFFKSKKTLQLNAVEKALVDEPDSVRIENLIGATSLPLGVAGPLALTGEHIKGEYFIPLATTEGALVASVARGCKAISLSGGAHVFAYRAGTTRGPVFIVKNLTEQKRVYKWIKENATKLSAAAVSTSHHLTLKKTEVRALATYVFVRFYFNTEDAMGMNMATFATEKMAELIAQETGAQCLTIAGNFDIDKKPAWLNFINYRGFKGWAEVVLSEKTLNELLKTTAQKLFDVWLSKCMLGSAMSGSLGFNAHYANIVAAFFAATGQDLGHVGEGSMGITTVSLLPTNAVHFAIYMPALMVGTVGGGTGLKTQKEARDLIGITKSEEIAEVLVGAVLAGELSLLSSLAEGTLAKAHKALGRR